MSCLNSLRHDPQLYCLRLDHDGLICCGRQGSMSRVSVDIETMRDGAVKSHVSQRTRNMGYPAVAIRGGLRRIWQELHRNRQEAQASGRYALACGAVEAVRISQRRRRRNNAEAQTWKKQLGSFGPRPRLHGNELFLRPARRQAGDDLSSSDGRGTRHHILRHGRGLRSVHERGTRRRSACSVPRAGGDRHQVRVQT